jgi:hypothetical protein
MRNFAMETQTVLVTASQLNRSAVEEVEFDHSHIAGGISKIQTADNVIGIFTSNAMRERGQYQLQLLKTRSSSGVGSKVSLLFNRDSLRITDDDNADENGTGTPSGNTSNVMDTLRKKTTVKTEDEDDTPVMDKGQAASSLRAMLKTKTRSAFDET